MKLRERKREREGAEVEGMRGGIRERDEAKGEEDIT